MGIMRSRVVPALTLLVATAAFGADYTGPRPAKVDLPYLLHASNLVATDAVDAQQESKKDTSTYTIPGAAATAKTPLAEPIFIIQADRISADLLELYKFDVKNGHREVSTSSRRTRGGPRPLRLTVTRLEKGLYRVEASETLENGEYGLSPSGSNRVFCFSVY